MYNISDKDHYFAINTKIKKDGTTFFDVRNEPFKVYGVL